MPKLDCGHSDEARRPRGDCLICAWHREKAHARAYSQRPEVKKRTRVYARAYRQRPEVREYQRLYNQRPEVKERQRAYQRAYFQRVAKPRRLEMAAIYAAFLRGDLREKETADAR